MNKAEYIRIAEISAAMEGFAAELESMNKRQKEELDMWHSVNPSSPYVREVELKEQIESMAAVIRYITDASTQLNWFAEG